MENRFKTEEEEIYLLSEHVLTLEWEIGKISQSSNTILNLDKIIIYEIDQCPIMPYYYWLKM